MGTEHILLGLLRVGGGPASDVLANLGVTAQQINDLVEQSVRKGRATVPQSQDLPYTSRGKKVIDHALDEAAELNHQYVGTEHILLGLLREEGGIAAQVLNQLGISLAGARTETIKQLSGRTVQSEEGSGPRVVADVRLLEQLQASYYGPAWHGPTLRELLADVSHEAAVRHPIDNAHSIWEIVLHATAWKAAVTGRLTGAIVTPTSEQDWPPVQNPTAAAWLAATKGLDRAHQALTSRVEHLEDADLNRRYPPDGGSFYSMIHGVLQHDLYHAGQVALLKKVLRAQNLHGGGNAEAETA